MINIFSHTFQCSCVLLEYAEGQGIEDFDLSLQLNNRVIDEVLTPRYPHLEAELKALYIRDSGSGVMIDQFLSEESEPAVVSLTEPELLFKQFEVEAIIDPTKQLFASVVYLGRNKLARVVYRNAENPTKTDVHNADGSFSHHETVYNGSLPESLDWAFTRLEELKELGINAKINHFKDNKVYFAVRP